MTLTKDQIRSAAEADLTAFIALVHPGRMLGDIHREVIRWWCRPKAKSHQLLLLPRDHMKSALVAYRVAWTIVKNPTVRVLYVSATEQLAIKQLKFIKDILASEVVRKYWPDLVAANESDREKWAETEIAVDHPLRKAEAIRDPTVLAAGLSTNTVGLHSDISVYDDVVVPGNAYTQEGRDKVLTQYGALSSIEGTDAVQWVVGTRYFPTDLYATMLSINVEEFGPDGDVLYSEPLYEHFERVVEDSDNRDGSGQFVWPRQMRSDGKYFGFNSKVLARKRAAYQNKSHFFAQYYNDPNDVSESPIRRDWFQYYDPKYLSNRAGEWHFQGRRLNVAAAIDFAYSTSRKADYSAIVVAGVDALNNYYVLDIFRFKTTDIAEYYRNILEAHKKWRFRKLRAEMTAAQMVIVKDLKDNYIRKYGLTLSIEEHKPTRHMGAKEERIQAILQPRYANLQVWHASGGFTSLLEEELTLKNPPHDDLKDALASAVDALVAPSPIRHSHEVQEVRSKMTTSRFGGMHGAWR